MEKPFDTCETEESAGAFITNETHKFLTENGINESNYSDYGYIEEADLDTGKIIRQVWRNGESIASIQFEIAVSKSNRPVPAPAPKKKQTTDKEDWQLALDQCNEIISLCDDLPEAADDFASSVSEKVQNISEWIEENKHVTETQQDSLDNMQSGCERWIH